MQYTDAKTSRMRYPSLNLKGDWLAEAGFKTGIHITIKISEDCTIIILNSEEVDGLNPELLRGHLRDAKLINQNFKNVFH